MSGDDRELLARLCGGPPRQASDALAELYARHAGAVLRFLGRLLDPHLAEDVLQDTFLTASRRAHGCRGGDARPWLLAIAGNRARDLRRAGSRRSAREKAAARSEEVAPAHAAELEPVLRALADRDRVVLELRFTQDLTHAQVAAVLGVSERTAKSWAARALEHLRERLEEQR